MAPALCTIVCVAAVVGAVNAWTSYTNIFGDIHVFGGNAPPNAKCVFPSEYKGKTLWSCTQEDHVRPWCPTTETYSRDKRWGNCILALNSTRSEIPTFGGNGNGRKCAIPFVYDGITYYGCINALHYTFWCSVTARYDVEKLWGNCDLDVITSGLKTTGGNSHGRECSAVYMYHNKFYTGCTKVDYDRLWCGVAYSYELSGQWGECLSDTAVVTDIKTYGGNAASSNCVFPSVYKGQTVRECITSDFIRLWCPTTDNYDRDQRWGNCVIEMEEGLTLSGEKCVFPFRYEGVNYQSCTTAMSSVGKPWCATVASLAKDGKQWGFCAPVVDTVGGTANGARCYFPYIYQGKKWYQCLTANNDGVLWCATTPNYDLDQLWGNCVTPKSNIGVVGGNSYGETCVFPFIYKGYMYNQCIMQDYSQNWCATTANYDQDKKWGNCPY